MNIKTRVQNGWRGLAGHTATNDYTESRRLANDFLRYGNREPIYQDWSQVEMSDKDMYTGYSYAVIEKRANRASALGKKFLYTEASKAIIESSKEKDVVITHPYLDLIKRSKEFSQRKFWHDISTYLDLEGVYYLMAVRAVGQTKDGKTKVGEIQKFTMLNPYEVKRVVNGKGELGGYVEAKDGRYREIPKEMIIEIRLLNPFDNDLPYSMTDAAKESQFTMKQAGDYTRHSIKGNINAPGAITTDVLLDDPTFDNFVSRIKNHEKGEPLYGNGTGSIHWEAMQIDLDKAALDKINDIHRSMLFSVGGVSDMLMGQQKAGTGREVSKTQKDEFTENAVMPQVEDVIDALNLDYRKWYPEWEKNEYEIALDNPLEADRESELKDIEIRETRLALRDSLVDMGYEYDIAASYANGDISLEELGKPTLPPKQPMQEGGEQIQEEEPTETEETEIDEDADANLPDLSESIENQAKEIAKNAGKGNPYRDKQGRFASGPGGASIESTNEAAESLYNNNAKIERSRSNNTIRRLIKSNREATMKYFKDNDADINKFRSIEEEWVGNNYKVLENHVKNKDSRELQMMTDLQQTYFKNNNIKEVTVYRGVYNKQAKEIKAAIKSGKPIKLSPDYASSWTGYDVTAREFADGGAYTAPDKITDSVVIKQTFKVKDVVYSTQVSNFYAGSTMDEFIITTPKGVTISSDDVEVIK